MFLIFFPISKVSLSDPSHLVLNKSITEEGRPTLYFGVIVGPILIVDLQGSKTFDNLKQLLRTIDRC